MDYFNYRYGTNLNCTLDNTRKGYGSCFQIVKNPGICFFAYQLPPELPKQWDQYLTILQKFIEEFEFKITVEINDNWLILRDLEPDEKYLNLYAVLIFSRFGVSGDNRYIQVYEYIIKAYSEGYSPFESYLIASLFEGYNYYSFTHSGLFNIKYYRNLKNKKSLFKRTSCLNENIEFMLKRKPKNLFNSNIDNFIQLYLEAITEKNVTFTKINKEAITGWKQIRVKDCSEWLEIACKRQGIDKRILYISKTRSMIFSYEEISQHSPEEFLEDFKEELLNNKTKKGDFKKTKLFNTLYSIFDTKNLNLLEYIEKWK